LNIIEYLFYERLFGKVLLIEKSAAKRVQQKKNGRKIAPKKNGRQITKEKVQKKK
jgi:hypothetical protein